MVGAEGAVAAALRRAGARVVLAAPVAVRRLVEQVLGAYGRLDLAVNDTVEPGVSLAMRYEAAAMRRTGGGRIVNVALTVEVIELTRLAAVELAGSGIRINAVAGGADEVADAVVRLCSAPGH